MLIDNDTITIDHERLRHAGRTDRQLHLAGRVAPDPAVWIAPSVEEIGDIFRSIAAGYGVDLDPCLLQRQQLRRFGNTRHAPAGENIEKCRLALLQIGAG